MVRFVGCVGLRLNAPSKNPAKLQLLGGGVWRIIVDFEKAVGNMLISQNAT